MRTATFGDETKPPMTDATTLLKLVQQKLREKDEIIHEQQRQITELEEVLRTGGAGGGAPEMEELVREQMLQINDLNERLSIYEANGSPATEEAEELVAEQMRQILEYQERTEQLETQLRDFNAMQGQLKELLGGN